MNTVLRLEPALRPEVEARTYRDAMAAMGTTACVVTARLGAERLGRTVTSVFSLSIDPPTILVSIDRASRLAGLIETIRGFSFAMLAADQEAIASAFAGQGDPAERFETGEWRTWKSGHPRPIGALAAMDCEVSGTIETRTHLLFAGEAVDIDHDRNRIPLIWQDRQFKPLAGT